MLVHLLVYVFLYGFVVAAAAVVGVLVFIVRVMQYVRFAIAICVNRLVDVNWSNALPPVQQAVENDRMVCADGGNQQLYFRVAIHLIMDRAAQAVPCHFSNRKCNR